MRTLTESQAAALSNVNGYSARARVRVLGPEGIWRDFSRLPVGATEVDFLDEVSVDTSLDEPVAQARVRLRRAVGAASLAPLMLDSPFNLLTSSGAYEPLLRGGRTVVVDVALSPLGAAPREEDYLEVFRGRVDSPTDSGETIEFTARDYAGLLQDTMIEVEREYGSDAGVPVQTVQQAILDDNGLSAFGLYTPVDPEWDVGKYLQKKESVLEAVRALATQLGADLQYRWSPVDNAFALGLYLPERTATTPVWSYGERDYRTLPEVSLPVEEVRTAVTVWYWDKADLDAAGNPKLKRVDRQAASGVLADLGRRWSGIALAATDNIDTAAEAGALADWFIADCSQPPLAVSCEVPANPALELGDMVTLEANGVQYSEDQTAAVRQVTLTYSRDAVKTRLVLSGKPSLSKRVWLSKETGRPGLPRTAPYTGPSAPTVSSVKPVLNGLAVVVAPALRGPDTAEYELHVSTTPGFTPDTAHPSTTLKAVSATTRFELSSLSAGTGYYGRVVPRDAQGNRGASSPEFSLTAAYLPPAGLQPQVSFGVLPLNGHLEAQSDTTKPPDGCKMVGGSWGVDAAMESATVYSGGRSVRLVARAVVGTQLAFQAFVAVPGERWACKAQCYSSFSGATAQLVVRWLDSSFASLSTANVAATALGSGVWTQLSGYVVVPTGARYAQVEIGAGPTSSSPSVYFDSVTVDPSLTVVPAWNLVRHTSLGGSFNDYTNGWAPDLGRPFYWRLNCHGEFECRGSVKSGTLGSACFTLANVAPSGASSSSSPARWRVPDGASGEATVSVYASGTSAVFAVTGGNTQVALDSVRYSVA